jgi:hypothetical protein
VKNTFRLLKTHAEIDLTSPKYGTQVMLLDLEDILRLHEACTGTITVQWNPFIKNFYGVFRITPGKSGKSVTVHRWLMGFPEGLEVDHIHHNTLDNRQSQLRIVTRSENQRNKRPELKRTKPSFYICANTRMAKGGVVDQRWSLVEYFLGKRKHIKTGRDYAELIAMRKELIAQNNLLL